MTKCFNKGKIRFLINEKKVLIALEEGVLRLVTSGQDRHREEGIDSEVNRPSQERGFTKILSMGAIHRTMSLIS